MAHRHISPYTRIVGGRLGVIEGNPVIDLEVDPLLELSRLIEVEERYFEYELTPFPTSLFKDSVMRTTPKAGLAKELTKSLPTTRQVTKTKFILDGGSLLYRVKWTDEKTYTAVFNTYRSYVCKRYNDSDIIFDGYGSGLSTKDYERNRRYCSSSSEDIQINEENRPHSQKKLLANTNNKAQFIKQPSEYLLKSDKCYYSGGVLQSEGDADTLIISEAINRASNGEHVTVVSDDTDILVLLLYHWKTSMADIHLQTSDMDGQIQRTKLTSIKEAIEHLVRSERPVLDHLLVIHAWGGCDTTSAIYNQGKNAILDLVKNSTESDHVRQWCKTIEDHDATQDEVGEAGAQIFVKMFDGEADDTLTKLRLDRYQNNPATTILGMRPLPPTEGAALQHSLRVHLQVMEWKHLNVRQIDPCKWGWVIKKDANIWSLVPNMTNQQIAPINLVQHVICECETSSQNACMTNHCSCLETWVQVYKCDACMSLSRTRVWK